MTAVSVPAASVTAAAGIDVAAVSRNFGEHQAVDDVSLRVPPGSVHALLGPNGAGKTTLLRMLCGLIEPAAGEVRVAGLDSKSDPVEVRRRIGFVPSGDRSFYLRLSGHENLVFFARLHGLRRREASRRAADAIERVGLADAARRRVGLYSHGMHKRLSVARALLVEPPVLLVDEATHDLDPGGAAQVQTLVRAAADDGAAVLWATQRLDEIRDFADRVTVLNQGRVRFSGTVPELMSLAADRSYVLELAGSEEQIEKVAAAFAADVTLEPMGDTSAHWLLHLRAGAVLGHAVAALQEAGVDVYACREQRSGLHLAFLRLTEDA